MLRPAAILLEHLFVSGGNALVLVLPIAAIALTISSIPVHLDYFRSHENAAGHGQLGRRYASALTIVTLLALAVLATVVGTLPVGLSATLAAATCFTFIVEKYADETSRAFEFRKSFVKWFLVQAWRSGWLTLPVVASAVFHLPYDQSFLVASALSAVGAMMLFWRVTGLAPQFSRDAWGLIRSNSIFLSGNLLPSFYQQMPRVLVARLFPDQAHIYIVLAQVCQGISLLFNVRFQIPYRKVTARRPRHFERQLRPMIFRLLAVIACVAAAYLLLPAFGVLSPDMSGTAFVAILAPALVADALMFALFSVYLGYMPWFVDRKDAFVTYLLCLCLMGLLAIIIAALDRTGWLSIFNLAAMFTMLGLAWLGVIYTRHFRKR